MFSNPGILTFLGRLLLFIAHGLFWLVCLLVIICILPLQSFYWHELAQAFWWQYGFMLLAAGILAALSLLIKGVVNRQKPWDGPRIALLLASLLGSAGILWPLQQELPWWPRRLVRPGHETSPPVSAQSPPNTIRILQHNVYRFHTDFTGLVELVLKQRSDVIGLEEVDARSLGALDKQPWIHAHYPYRLFDQRAQSLILSHWPILEAHVAYDTYRNPYLYTRIKTLMPKPLTLIIVHPPHPTESYQWLQQKALWDTLQEREKDIPRPLVILGDMNTTPYNQSFLSFQQALQLRDPRTGVSLLPTWPSYLPWPLRLPLDYILISRDLELKSQSVLPSTGSDHLPIEVTVRFIPAR